MLSKRWPKILVLIIGVILVGSLFTDADFIVKKYIKSNHFSATTLDFSNRKTASELPTSTLFNISGFIPEGFEIASIRIKKEGEMDFLYSITADIKNSSSLCNYLEVEIYDRKLSQLFSGNIENIYIVSDVKETYDDLIFIVSLLSDEGKNKRCDFDLVINSINSDQEINTGLWDQEILQNYISS